MMNLRTTSQLPTARFSRILDPRKGDRPVYDRILFETSECVVVPTLGSILPRWLLIIPKATTVNFAQFSRDQGCDPSDLVAKVLLQFGLNCARFVWFEHGASKTGSDIGCGVDQAHLHLLVDPPFDLDLFEVTSKKLSNFNWVRYPTASVYGTLKDETYLLAASGRSAFVARHVEKAGSQFFRRVVSEIARMPDRWDYKAHPFLNNIRETLRIFGSDNA